MIDPEALPIPDFGLRCLNCGYLLAGLPSHRCPECGRTIRMEEHIPPGDWPMVILDGSAVKVTPQISSLMSTYQIPLMPIVSTGGAGEISAAFGGADPSSLTGDLRVPRHCFFDAVELLRRKTLGEAMPEPPPPAEHLPDWKCSECGEENPGHFEICWNCEHARQKAS